MKTVFKDCHCNCVKDSYDEIVFIPQENTELNLPYYTQVTIIFKIETFIERLVQLVKETGKLIHGSLSLLSI